MFYLLIQILRLQLSKNANALTNDEWVFPVELEINFCIVIVLSTTDWCKWTDN